MGENTAIEWADHTFNPWVGCTKISPGCDHCYAEGWAKRSGQVVWGPHGERVRTTPANWAKPRKWAKAAEASERRPFVFCASLADVFDNQVEQTWRDDLFDLAADTPELVWLFLTKRPQNILGMTDRQMPPNIAFGASVCLPGEAARNAEALQRAADRHLPEFLFVSAEPLLGDIASALQPYLCRPGAGDIEWVICGGESGPQARPMHPHWVGNLQDACSAAGTDFLLKQWGDWRPTLALEGTEFPSLSMDVTGRINPEPNPCLPEDADPFWTAWLFERVGKKAAGRLLDGVIHDARPVR